MEGLIPLVINAMKRQRPQSAYRSLSETSSGRSYHLLIAGDSVDGGSSHHRTRSDFPSPRSKVENFLSGNSEHLPHRTGFGAAAASPSSAGNKLRQRGFAAADRYRTSARTATVYGR